MRSTFEPTNGRSFKDLVAWQKCREVRKAVSILVKTWPAHEKFKLIDQIQRSSRGPCANIAEGYGRFYEKENVRFCLIARGSLFETMDHLTAALDEAYIDQTSLDEYWALCEEAVRVLNGYINYLERFNSKGGVGEPEVLYRADPTNDPFTP
jgi:four helix bundle protein